MGELAGWLIFIGYWIVGISRLPVYFKRIDAWIKKDFPYSYNKEDSYKTAGWVSWLLVMVWPFYELWYNVRKYTVLWILSRVDEPNDRT